MRRSGWFLFFALLLLGLLPFITLHDLSETSADGTGQRSLSNGTHIIEMSDHTVIIQLLNGLTITLPAGETFTIQGSGKSIELARYALHPGEMSDGTKLTSYPDGKVQVELIDGSVITVSGDNEVTVTDNGRMRLQQSTAVPASQSMSCTFTATTAINLRSGPGRQYDRTGSLSAGDTLNVTGQATGNEGFIWWQSGSQWVRSDLGTSTCPAMCGNRVCERGENSTSCSKDCGGASTASNGTTGTTATGCLVDGCQSCYESISCYPTCSECTCSKNGFGCTTCFCTTPSGQGSNGTNTTGNGCKFSSCEACIAAFPCWPKPCSSTECHLNDFGCPVCSTSQ